MLSTAVCLGLALGLALVLLQQQQRRVKRRLAAEPNVQPQLSVTGQLQDIFDQAEDACTGTRPYNQRSMW